MLRRTYTPRRTAPTLTILLTDGSSLAARQVATALAWQGHRVEAVDSNPLCLARMTRHVRVVHRVPPFGHDPSGWLAAVLQLLESRRFDLLFPTQEQAALLARDPEQVRQYGAGIAVPPFSALELVQDKVSAETTLRGLDLPRPETWIAHSAAELRECRPPVFVKRAVGTASNGVEKVTTLSELNALAARLEEQDALSGGVVAQRPATGPLIMVQALYDRGRLIAYHSCERMHEGAGGGASSKVSRRMPELRPLLVRFGEQLNWHAAASFDVIRTSDGPSFIDVNPRLVEPLNAMLAGVDLVDAMVRLSLGQTVPTIGDGRPGVRTHQLLLGLLGAAREGRGRRGVLSELLAGLAGYGKYRRSMEELTPSQGDILASAPVVYAAARLLSSPATWDTLSGGAVGGYALTPDGWQHIRAMGNGKL